jgi:glutaredoxin
MKPRVTFYTRAGCCLCENAKAVIARARERADFDYDEFDIDSDPALRSRFNDEVPVTAINGAPAFRYGLDLETFLKKLAERR